MVTIKSETALISIAEKGAEIKSFIVNGKEQIWQSDPAFWTGSAPFLFPICGGLKDDEYFLNGKKYTLSKHGFARKKMFTVESTTENSATFLLKDDEETYVNYPFHFELRLTYTLCGNKVTITNEIKNLNNETMYFCIGSHEAYACDEGIQDYDIVLPEKETLYSYALQGVLLAEDKELILDDSDTLPLDYKYFAVDALVFKDIKARSVKLRKRDGSREIEVCYDGFYNLMLWTKPNAGYICIEPWDGVPDRTFTTKQLAEKEGITALPAGETYVRNHTVEILK